MELDFTRQSGKRIIIKEKNTTSSIDIENITTITCDSYVCCITTYDKAVYYVSHLLKQYESELKEYGFLRANHNTLVNIRHISDVKILHKKKYISLNGTIIAVSRRRSAFFRKIVFDGLKK